MDIRQHRLVPGWYKASPNHGRPLVDPTLLVMHFTASGGGGPEADADYFLQPAARASAHVVVGRDGAVQQVVPFNVQAWHAGVSVWRGRGNCNAFSIGVEVDNWGRLVETADGQVRSWTGEPLDRGEAVRLTHKGESSPSLWETYGAVQLDALETLTRTILAAYPTIREVVGHDDIAPGRKVDPGPAFPMARFADLVGGRADAPPQTRTVLAHQLNARDGAGLQYPILGTFPQGAVLEVLYDSPAGWAQVSGPLATGVQARAWVADAYLR